MNLLLTLLVGMLVLLAVGAWLTALVSAFSLWRIVPQGNRLKSLFDMGWLQIDSIRELAGPEGDHLARRYVWALVVFFVAFAGLGAVMVAIFVTGRSGGIP